MNITSLTFEENRIVGTVSEYPVLLNITMQEKQCEVSEYIDLSSFGMTGEEIHYYRYKDKVVVLSYLSDKGIAFHNGNYRKIQYRDGNERISFGIQNDNLVFLFRYKRTSILVFDMKDEKILREISIKQFNRIPGTETWTPFWLANNKKGKIWVPYQVCNCYFCIDERNEDINYTEVPKYFEGVQDITYFENSIYVIGVSGILAKKEADSFQKMCEFKKCEVSRIIAVTDGIVVFPWDGQAIYFVDYSGVVSVLYNFEKEDGFTDIKVREVYESSHHIYFSVKENGKMYEVDLGAKIVQRIKMDVSVELIKRIEGFGSDLQMERGDFALMDFCNIVCEDKI